MPQSGRNFSDLPILFLPVSVWTAFPVGSKRTNPAGGTVVCINTCTTDGWIFPPAFVEVVQDSGWIPQVTAALKLDSQRKAVYIGTSERLRVLGYLD